MMREPEAPAFSPVSSRVAQVLDIKLKFPVSVLFEAMFPVGIVPGSRKLADFVLLDEQIWFVGVAPCAGAWHGAREHRLRMTNTAAENGNIAGVVVSKV